MKQNKETLKDFFETGDKPTQEQYSDLIDSYIDNQQEAGEPNRRFVIDETGEVAVTSALETPEYTLSEITNNKITLLKDGEIATEIDLTPYIDDTNLARLVSGSIDQNGFATFSRDDDSEFVVDLSSLISLPTNLSYEAHPLKGEIISSTGLNATIPLANASNAGLMKAGFYEEGIFEPNLYTGEYLYSVENKIASYIRIGNLVHFNIFFLNISDPADINGDLIVKGLPFNQNLYNNEISSITELENVNINDFISQGTQRSHSLKATILLDNIIKFRNDNASSATKGFSFVSNGRLSLSGVYRTDIYTP